MSGIIPPDSLHRTQAARIKLRAAFIAALLFGFGYAAGVLWG